MMRKCRATFVLCGWSSFWILIHSSHVTTVVVVQACSPSLTLAFAAASKNRKSSSSGGGGSSGKNKKKAPASVGNGFGIAPLTYDEVLNTFPTRIPEHANEQLCPCGIEKGRLYGECCGPLHQRGGDEKTSCQTMTDVLKSRYSAFSWRIVDHIIRTTHSTNRDYQEDPIAWARNLNRNGMFDSYEFVKLQAGPEEYNNNNNNHNEGFIEFQVTLKDKGDKDLSLRGKETIVRERSRFVRNPMDGVWTYAGGKVRTDVAGLQDTVLNN